MTQPFKANGPWNQGLYEISATAKEVVGTLRIDRFGRKFRYARAGATALDPGKQTIAATINDDWTDNAVATGGAAVGDFEVTMTVTDVDSDVLPVDYFRGGQLFVQDGSGEGTWYPIAHSEAIIDGQTSFTVTLSEPLKVALAASTSYVTPVPSPWMATVISATITSPLATGVPLVTVTANYYYWSQTGGEGIYWADGDVAAIGTHLVLGADDGKLIPKVLNLDGSVDADDTLQTVAYAWGVGTPVDTEYCPCRYCID